MREYLNNLVREIRNQSIDSVDLAKIIVLVNLNFNILMSEKNIETMIAELKKANYCPDDKYVVWQLQESNLESF